MRSRQFLAVHARHDDVGQHHADLPIEALRGGDRLAGVRRLQHRKSHVAENGTRQLAHLGLVFHQQHRTLRKRDGRTLVLRPWSGLGGALSARKIQAEQRTVARLAVHRQVSARPG